VLETVQHYFPQLTATQKEQLAALPALYAEWNAKINVISRKDMDMFEVHHVLHSLAIARYITFKPGAEILDLGTGGGFPGIPLAIMFPDSDFHLVDSIGKKITVVNAVAEALGLKNIQATHTRVEQVLDYYDFVVSRAVAPLPDLVKWAKPLINKNFNHDIKNGLICLKGGDLAEEIGNTQRKVYTKELSNWFAEPFFETKKLVYVSLL
jgi:16S rRNA (guanine527-N7)-methyltransferase